ncbi:HDOD domain-containing protein [Chitinimonas sp. BJYL2]|uniref:HDOD domain-containing protein n=1 Tax=Chitinimonas sp. BJYL2 TaxID=2976696 RepID=UPI0022B375D3|nr:HDOD domain-containing protein [Chitinimonas sp. BJYL2]
MAIQLSDDDAAKLLKSLTLPPIPGVLAELRAAQSREADADVLAALIGRDLSLTAAVLKTANSPAFSARQLDSLRDAVMVLGAANLDSVVTGVALKKLVPLPPILGRFWDEATRIAAVAAALAKHWKQVRPDQAYLFCLFRDSGIPVLTQRFPSYINTLARAMNDPGHFVEIESKSRGASHVVVGYLLARSWYLPDVLNLAILHHHDFADLGDRNLIPEEAAHLIALARLAEYLLQCHLIEGSDHHWPLIAETVLATLELGEVDLPTAVEIALASNA